MANYYINPVNGDNSRSGTSVALAWRTLEEALRRGLQAGDTVHLMEGKAYTPEGSHWTISGLVGQASAPITFRNYTGHSPVLNGDHVFPKTTGGPGYKVPGYTNKVNLWPSTTIYGRMKMWGAWTALITVNNCSHIVWDGIDVMKSRGRGITISGTSDNITVKNCDVGYSGVTGMLIQGDSSNRRVEDITVENCSVYQSSYWHPYDNLSVADHTAGMSIKNVNGVTITDSRIYNNWGQGVLCDSNTGQSDNVTIADCEIYDCMRAPVYAQAWVKNFVLERCLVYYSGGSGMVTRPANDPYSCIVVRPLEKQYWGQGTDPTYATIRNCIIYGGRTNINVAGNVLGYPRSYVDILNCTIVNSQQAALNITTVNGNTYLRNNIIQEGTAGKISGIDTAGTISADYNLWSHQPPAALRGTHDPGYSAYSSQTIGLADWDRNLAPGAGMGVGSYWRLTTGSDAIGAGVDLSAIDRGANLADGFEDDYWGNERVAPWDIGAHETDGVAGPGTPLSATAGVSNSPQAEGTAINFTGSAAGGTTPYSYAWDFGTGGLTAATQNPSQAFPAWGTYEATLTVTDAEGLSATDTVAFQVLPVSSGTAAPVTIKQVALNVGDATFDPDVRPKAMLFVASGASTNGTAANDAKIGFGVWSPTGQYSAAAWDKHGAGTTDTVSIVGADSAIRLRHGLTSATVGTVGTVSDSSVPISWSGETAGTERVLAYVFGGSGVSNVYTGLVSLTNNGTRRIDGDYNIIFACSPISTNLTADTAIGRFAMNMGAAVRDVKQASAALMAQDNQSAADVRAVLDALSIGRFAFSSSVGTVDVGQWDNSGVTLTATSTSDTFNFPLMILAMKLDIGIDLQVIDLPSTTAATDYDHDWTPQQSILIGTTLPASQVVATDSTAGSLTWASVDSADVDYSIGVSIKDAAGTTVSKSYTDAKFAQLADDGTVENEGALTVEADATRLTLTTAGGTAFKGLLLAFESSATNDNPQAAFTVEEADIDAGLLGLLHYYDSPITFTDASVSDGTHNTLTYDWDWGDGSEHGDDADMSGGGTGTGETIQHTYTRHGSFTVTLTVTDNNDDIGTYSERVLVAPPPPTISGTISPASGNVPFDVEIDFSGTTAGGDEEMNAALQVVGPNNFLRSYSGLTADVEIEGPGSYDVELYIGYVGYEAGEFYNFYVYEDAIVAADNPRVFIETVGRGPFVVVGAADLTFTVVSAGDLETATILWDFGDNDADPDLASETVTNTFAAVETATTYDVTVTVTWPDGTESSDTLADWVTVIPPRLAPINLQQIGANWAIIQAHAGDLSGATWVRLAAPNANVWAAELDNHEWAEGMTVSVLEDGEPLTAQASIVAAQAAAGSSYAAYSAGTLTIYVHPTGSDNPNLNESLYRWVH